MKITYKNPDGSTIKADISKFSALYKVNRIDISKTVIPFDISTDSFQLTADPLHALLLVFVYIGSNSGNTSDKIAIKFDFIQSSGVWRSSSNRVGTAVANRFYDQSIAYPDDMVRLGTCNGFTMVKGKFTAVCNNKPIIRDTIYADEKYWNLKIYLDACIAYSGEAQTAGTKIPDYSESTSIIFGDKIPNTANKPVYIDTKEDITLTSKLIAGGGVAAFLFINKTDKR